MWPTKLLRFNFICILKVSQNSETLKTQVKLNLNFTRNCATTC